MEEQKESVLNNYPNIISYDCLKKIIEQMERNICKVNIGEEQGTGFFCKIPFPNQDKILPVIITNNHVINRDALNKDKIELGIKNEETMKVIKLNNRMKYINEEYDITIIEIKEEDNINNYLELDDLIINEIINNQNKNEIYKNEAIYIIQYPENKLLSVSYGILDNIYEDKKYNFKHKCNTKGGSSGSPLLNINNNKIIGIHKEGNKQYNGTFLNYPIKEFIKLNTNNYKTEILLKEFNIKYDTNINDAKINKLDLNVKNLGNEGLNDLCIIGFKELKELNLRFNNILDIKVLEKAKFDKLEILNLYNNQISDIDILEKVNFKELKELNLSCNNISDIKVLEKANFIKLEKLYLRKNQISDINILEKVNFKELKELYLLYNNISDIKVLEKVKFDKLELLDLLRNQISEKKNESIISKLKTKIKVFSI